tara:strand:- start:52 stop:1089 length:1038 start_codon:yes stop_codon:yes gene_type:complete
MSLNIFCKPRLLINDKEVAFCKSATFQANEGSLQSFSASITEPDLENSNLFNQKVEFYLNYGSEDGVPLFRGYIKSFKSNDESISISAIDPRTVITGNNALPIVIDNQNNYDGVTIVQFLLDIIENEVNINKTLISTDTLNEMDKPIYMTGVRNTQAPYDIVNGLMKTQRDKDNMLSVYEYYFDIIHGGQNSSLVIRKTKDLTGTPDFVYKYNDGIISLDYTERAPPSFAIAQAADGTSVRADYGNAPSGNIGINVANETYSSRAEAKEAAMAEILLKQEDNKDISMNVSKGHYINLGHIIRIDVPDSNIVGQYRVTSKNISFSNNSVTCQLKLNKKPIKVSDYI